MGIARSVGAVALLVVGGCKVQKPAASAQPQASIFCSTAYPYGIAQEDRANAPPLFKVAVEQPFVAFDDSAIRVHFVGEITKAAAWSGTQFEMAMESETPTFIIELDINETGDNAYGVAAKIQGREDIHVNGGDDGPQDARILFTLSIDPDGLTEVLGTTAREIAQFVTEGWTCEGDFPKHARRFGE